MESVGKSVYSKDAYPVKGKIMSNFKLILRPDTSGKKIVLWQLPSGKLRSVPFVVVLGLLFVLLLATALQGMQWRHLFFVTFWLVFIVTVNRRKPFIHQK